MTTSCNDIRDEFSMTHGGTAQSERPSLALDPAYVQVDERSFAQWIVFVRDYARFVQYFNSSNTADGDWTDFWSANPAIILANLASAPLDDFREVSRQLFIELEKLEYQDDTAADNAHLNQHFQQLFSLMTTLAWQLDRHIQLLPDDLPAKDALRSRVSQKLAPALSRWLAWHKHALNEAVPPLVDNGQGELSDMIIQFRVLGHPVQNAEDFYNNPDAYPFSGDWLTAGATDWDSYITTTIQPDGGIFGSDPAVPVATSAALRHYFFTGVYEQFIQAFALAMTEAEKSLRMLLSDWNQHEPHFALFLAFLRLLTKEQAYLNTLTDRHLRFYYERVLRMYPLAARPHQAYLTVELAKHVDRHLLPAGTLFKAGKDETGREINFALHEDFVANKAKVTDLRTIFKVPHDPSLYQFGDTERPVYKNSDRDRYYAATVSNSADGIGEMELATDDGRWHPFGNRTVEGSSNTWSINAPKAEVGFAVASHYLYCQQGTRLIALILEGTGLEALAGEQVKLSLTIEKGWLEKKTTVMHNDVTNQYWIPILLEGDEEPILPYDVKSHGGNFGTDYPLIKVHLVQEDSSLFDYQALKNAKLTKVSVFAWVIGKRDMSWGSSTGPLDVSKPFHPFGPSPGKGSIFLMGDKELFQKKAYFSLRFNWKQKIDNAKFYNSNLDGVPYTELEMLGSGQWQNKGLQNMLAYNQTIINAFGGNQVEAANLIAPDFTENEPFSTETAAGYLRYQLKGDWGHAIYANSLAEYAKAANGTIPKPLYDPQLLDVVLDYLAVQETSLNATPSSDEPAATFYHLHPFGEAARHGGTSAVRLLPELVPQYNISTPDGPQNNVGKDGGEWLIGIEGLVPPQVLSLLLQVAPGTADPLLAKPAQHVQWWYLKGNDWQAFAKRDISDGTNQLLKSGLIRFSVPLEANESHTLLPSGKIWLRATVESAVDAVNQLIGVHAQGCAVTIIDNQNDPQLGALPLPAGTINKMLSPQAAVKKIVQPYATFGHSAKEDAASYYTRISERLRHKDRAITMWDYERILLQAFPQLHKIKCLNHLRYELASTAPIYRELAPGHVTIISVADLRKLNGVDRLRPYTSLADLNAMADFLKSRISCFVKLHVRNPRFEPVKATLKVKFYDGLDERFYEEQLNTDIVNFLSPWASDTNAAIDFDGLFYKSTLVNFIEELSYVDYITDLVLSHTTDATQQDVETVRPSTKISILVSARQHGITVLPGSESTAWQEDCDCPASGDSIGQATLVQREE